MKNIILTAIIIIFSFFRVNAQEVKEIEVISPTAFESQISTRKVQLIDVRTPKEYHEGTIYEALNVDFLSEDFAKATEKLDRSQPVYLFCQSGKRSAKAAKEMQEAGFKVIELAGGYKAWKAAKDSL